MGGVVKVLISANAPWTKTGYGLQGASLARRLRDAGHEVVYFCNYGLRGGVQEWEGITCLPTAQDNGYTDEILQGHLRYAQPDLLITLQDLWPWKGTDLPQKTSEQGQIPWAAWVPIDHEPLSAHNRDVLSRVDYPIAMSQHGQRMMSDVDIHSTLIPHGVEKDYGYTAAGRAAFRRLNLIPEDAFLFGTVGLNYGVPNRKGTERLMAALAATPNAYLYVHGTPVPISGSGLNLAEVAEFYGVADRVRFADPYNYVMGYSQDGMNAIYSALDCYVQPTMGEGFGVPVIEAQACGAVVIATDCTSMPELLCPDASQLVEGIDYLVPDMAHRKIILLEPLIDAMRAVMDIKENDLQGFHAMKGRAGLHANVYDWNKIWTEAWVPFLAEVEADIESSVRDTWHRGQAIVEVRENDVLKRDSTLKSPSVKKELDLLLQVQDIEGVIPVLDHGVDENGCTWFTMPKFTPMMSLPGFSDENGYSLEQQNASRADIIVNFTGGLRETLEALHARGIAHRDVHPSNVVIDTSWAKLDPYLIDFEWASSCDGEIGQNCVDFEPWAAMSHAVPSVQMGIDERGLHTVINHLRGLPLGEKTHGYKGVPYQQIDGVGERDCQLRWDLMQPDVEGKTVLDIGCNLGWFVRKAVNEGAKPAMGFDTDIAVIETAIELSRSYSPIQLIFGTRDIDSEQGREFLSDAHYDVIFCLSVLQHLKDPDRVFQWMLDHGETLYIEIPQRAITPLMAEHLNDAELLGESERGRPLYRLKVKEAVPA